MELLQKLTLYDLLGYTLSGIIFLWVCVSNGFLPELEQAQYTGGSEYWCALIILGYIAGIVIAELVEFISGGLEKIKEIRGSEKQYWNRIIKIYGISKEELEAALKNAKKDNNDIAQCNSAGDLLYQYRSYIYSDIQTDEKYSRLHNYASAELLYKNMTAVFAAASIMAVVQHELPKVIICVIGMICFFIRFMQFKERKVGYAACWYIQKYSKPSSPE